MTSYLEQFLKKSNPDEITYDDFLAFQQQGIEEHQHLEYKPRGILVTQENTIRKPEPGNPRAMVGFSELAKSVAGFANAEGGLLVLGVKEETERYEGQIVKIRPGPISPLPMSVTREMIENRLLEKIQYPIDGIRIVPLRETPTSTEFVYLIAVPQSVRAPHRVDELYYFQRYNFSTLEMKHFQIADLFGKRLAPDLSFAIKRIPYPQDGSGEILLMLTLHNYGRAVAKHVTCVCRLMEQSFRLFGYPMELAAEWASYFNKPQDVLKFVTSSDVVVYPDLPCPIGSVHFVPNAGPLPPHVEMEITLYAEDMPYKQERFSIPTGSIPEFTYP